jgi:hypothetical protein
MEFKASIQCLLELAFPRYRWLLPGVTPNLRALVPCITFRAPSVLPLL